MRARLANGPNGTKKGPSELHDAASPAKEGGSVSKKARGPTNSITDLNVNPHRPPASTNNTSPSSCNATPAALSTMRRDSQRTEPGLVACRNRHGLCRYAGGLRPFVHLPPCFSMLISPPKGPKMAAAGPARTNTRSYCFCLI